MSVFTNNLDFLYQHLPARYRSGDEGQGLLLWRFLQWPCEQLDGFDLQLDTFHEKINPDTAPMEFVEFWLWALFGWSYFPVWLSDAQRRALYRDMPRLYARRGTPRGISELLAHFGVKAHVINRTTFWGEEVWGEGGWMIGGPGTMVVQVFPQTTATPQELAYWGDSYWGDFYYTPPGNNLQQADVEELLSWCQPLATTIIIDYVQP